MTKSGDDEYSLKGNLTMHGITQAIEFKVEDGGIAKDPWGNTKAGFTLSGKVNRKDFGLTWNVATEAGGVLVSEEVKLLAEIQFAKQ
jgi:polyisoprenoid-binding protein YceI